MADAPKYPDFSQPSLMNPKYGPAVARMLGPLIREFQRQQQFGQAFGVSPRQAIKPTPEEMQRALNVGLAFGGADITKEQRAAWEAENRLYSDRALRSQQGGPKGLEPGTRVRDLGFPGETPEEAVIVDHRSPGEKPGFTGRKRLQPSPEHVAIRKTGQSEYYWRHPDELEVMPPEEKFKMGDEVVHRTGSKGMAEFFGAVTTPPKDVGPPPGPDYVWVDVDIYSAHPSWLEGKVQGMKQYASGKFGAWFPNKILEKAGKK